ncbi:DUF3969 family protein [Providencia alcalifaciens]|uniref:DUF3969 family protein n=1 Tax=Providencia alcalifaciens TaxID=126385 RepID=UPI001CE12E2C|nr:DUF3969 family protein [Providencia alcalifaciens]
MKLSYSLADEHASKFISFLALGVLTALDKNLISIDEAEGYIFKPYLSKLLEKIGSEEKLIDIVNLGCELDDVASLYPEDLQDQIKDLLDKTLSVISHGKSFGRLIDREIKIVED